VGNYNYSNVNFYVLAEIIKSVSGGSYQNYIANNIITPLGLTNTDFNTIPTGSFMRGYLKGTFYETGDVPYGLVGDSLYDFTEASNSRGYRAAEIWSNTTDLIKFHKALFNGQLINANWLGTMKKFVPNTGDMGSYGHGMMPFRSFNGGPIHGYGHTRTAFGYGDMLCYIPSLNVYICSTGNYMKIGQEFLQRDIHNFLANNIKTNLTQVKGSSTINIYPNPTSNILNINTTLPNFQLTIFDRTGKVVFQKSNSLSLDISNLAKGLYVLKLLDQNTMTTITKKYWIIVPTPQNILLQFVYKWLIFEKKIVFRQTDVSSNPDRPTVQQ